MDSQNTELFSQDPNGLFHIVFRNSKGLEKQDIEEIFSQFGKIYSVKECGDQFGYRFVRYKHFDEVQKAIRGLENHPLIKLAPPRRNKENGRTKNHNDNQDQGHRFNNDSTRNGYENKKHYNKETNNVLFENNFDTNQQTNYPSEAIKCKEDYTCAELNNSNTSRLSFSSDRNSSATLPLDSRSETNEEIPDLIASNRKERFAGNINKKKIIIDAGEVIVGNIHPNYGAPYILHLLDSYEPIAISNIHIVPKSSIRYCHVYFKSIEDCKKVEKFLDQIDLSGQKLIVQQPCNLIANGVY